MGKHTGKWKKVLNKAGESSLGQSRSFKQSNSFMQNKDGEISSSPTNAAFDKDNAIFIAISHELKEEGNRLFQQRDYEGAMIKYEKAIKLLPRNHIDVSHLRSNIAACYMQLGISEYPNAIQECNLALEVTPKYSKALLKRARCYEMLNRMDLALRDVEAVLSMEPNNLMAIEIKERVQEEIDSREDELPDGLVPLPNYTEPSYFAQAKFANLLKERTRRKKKNVGGNKVDGKIDENEKKMKGLSQQTKAGGSVRSKKCEDHIEEKKTEDKLVVEEEKIWNGAEEEPKRTVKLVFGDDIRWAKIPLGCSFLKLREIVTNRFPSTKTVLVKYRDQEGDMVTITTTEELRWAEASSERGSVKLYLVDVDPSQDPIKIRMKQHTENWQLGKRKEVVPSESTKRKEAVGSESTKKKEVAHSRSTCITDWIIQFAHLFRNYVGFDIDANLDLHEGAMKLYSEAIEETVTSEEAQDLFDAAAEKFQEMAALAMFNWGNVHMSRARKRVFFPEDSSKETVLERVKCTYDWAQSEYFEAGRRYEDALEIYPNFYEAVLALGQQQYEQAKLSWYYAIGTNVDLESWPLTEEVLQLYNSAEENLEKGIRLWDEVEELHALSKPSKVETLLQKMKLDNLIKKVSMTEALEQASNIRSQIYVLWGTVLYERSIMEYKLGLPVWHDCLEVAVEKFELAGASPADLGVMVKNHCSNGTASEGLGFRIDEIIQAWNEMYEAKRLQSHLTSFRVESLLRRRVSKLYYDLERA